MTTEELLAFLMTGTRTAKVATRSAAGAPHVVPVWFVLDGDALVFTMASDSVKARHLLADNRVAVCVDDEVPPFAFVSFSGRAELRVRPPDHLEVATVIARRYVGDARADEMGRTYVQHDDLVARVRLTRPVARTEIVT